MDLIIPESVRGALAEADKDNTPTAEVKGLIIPESVMASVSQSPGEIVIPESVYAASDSEDSDFFDGLKGLAIEAGEGLTFGALGELVAIAQAATSDDTYEEAKAEYEEARRRFKEENPNLAEYALPLELIASIPTGYGFFKTLGKIGIKSVAKQAGIEGATYGALSGEGAEDRAIKAITGGALGLSGGKIIDVATGAVKTAGRKLKDKSDAKKAEREKDIELEEDLGFDPDADNVTLIERVPEGEEAPYSLLTGNRDPQYQPITIVPEDAPVSTGGSRVIPEGPVRGGASEVVTPAYREAARPQFKQTVAGPEMGPSWKDATNAGELFQGVKSGLVRTYLRLKPMTDLLQSRVSRGVGALAQRADESATRTSQLEFENFVQPIQNIAEEWDNNKALRENTLLLSEGSSRMSVENYLSYIGKTFGEESKDNMARYLAWSRKKNVEFNERFSSPKNEVYLHRQRRYNNNKEYNKAIEEEFSLPLDPALKKRYLSVHDKMGKGGRARLIDGTDVADYYQNVFLTNSRRIMNNEKLLEYGKKFGVRGKGETLTAEQIMQRIGRELKKRGIEGDRADFAIQEIRRNLLGERKSMNQILQALQTLGYGGSLAGFKSALLNLHDVPQTAVTQGPMALRSWFKNIVKDKNGKMLSDSFGFSQQAKYGEFANALQQTLSTPGGTAKSLNNTANKTTNTLMKLSLFQVSDKVGKGGVLRAVQQRAVDDVERNGAKALKAKWGDYFSDYELRKMADDLKKHGMDDSKYSQEGLELIEEMMMAGLGQQQLISAGGRPAIWADHPNARVFLALRGFAMKQQAVALRNTLQNIQEGNIEEAKDYAIRYAIFSMGAFAAINEGRQVLFGDGEPSAQRVQRSFFDQLVGVISLNSASVNDYSWGKIQRGEFLSYVVDNNTPIAIGVPVEAVQDVLDTLIGEKEIGELPNTLPLIKQGRNAITNFQEASSN